MKLYHFSENPNIERFVARPPLAHPDAPARVWAIDEWHSPLYFVPSDCPRVCFWPLPTSTPADLADLFPDPSTRMVIAIELGWFERLQSTAIFSYEMPTDTFIDCQDHGVWVSSETVVPLVREHIGDPVAAMAEASVELRLCPSLAALGHRVMRSSLHFSLIRMRNAVGWDLPGGSPTIEKT